MCGRFSLTHSPEEVEHMFDVAALEAFPARYNIAPTQPVLVVSAAPPRAKGSNLPDREARLMRWGLTPSWVKDQKGFPLLINARSETAAQKPAFRAAMRHRRALIPASGFYEWERDSGSKQSQAYWVRPKHDAPVAFGALHETWIAVDGSEIDTVAILTTGANPAFAAIHDRMPVTIAPKDFDRWLDCRNQEPRDVDDLMTSPPTGFYDAIAVSDRVNKVANFGPDVQEPSEPKDFAKASDPVRKQPGPDDQKSLF